MQYTFAAVLALAATAVATYSNDTIVYTTHVYDQYVTVCPAGGAVTVGGNTYTNTDTVVRIPWRNGGFKWHRNSIRIVSQVLVLYRTCC